MKNTVVPETIKTALIDRDLIVFVGAGLSSPANCPSWEQLLTGLAEKAESEAIAIDDPIELSSLIKGSTFHKQIAASELQYALGEKMMEYITDRFRNVKPTQNHDLLSRLTLKGIITTNYDHLIEKAYQNSHSSELETVIAQDSERYSILKSDQPWLFKLHGSSERGRTIVLSSEDYERLARETATFRMLEAMLQNNVVLFVGFGLEDPDSMDTIRRLNRAYGGALQRHYALVAENSLGPAKKRFYKDNYNIQLLPYSNTNDKHEGVTEFLQQLAQHQAAEKEVTMEKRLLVITRPYRGNFGDGNGAILVTNNPQWATKLEGLSETDRLCYLLPYLSYSEYHQLDDQIAEYFGIPKESFYLRDTQEELVSEKFNPAIETEVTYTYTFIELEFSDPPPSPLMEQRFSIGETSFEWLTLESLRKHKSTMELNKDVIMAVSDRFGSRLNKRPWSLGVPIAPEIDFYAVRSTDYQDHEWLLDDYLLDLILKNAEAFSPTTIVDLGCGPSVLAHKCVSLGMHYRGLDSSRDVVERASENIQGLENCSVDVFDIATDSMSLTLPGECVFLLKNVIHLLDHPHRTLNTLIDRLGSPRAIIFVETVSPGPDSLIWIQALFAALRREHKKFWALKGQIESLVELAGFKVENTSHYEQFIDVSKWSDSWRISDSEWTQGEGVLNAISPKIESEMKVKREDGTITELLRLQEIVVAVPGTK
ncbi:MAG: SIR2 family protein [Verrucomicrobiales bacterium]|nr:SIR2 family protein [Verrucomicrobiales bacterium]